MGGGGRECLRGTACKAAAAACPDARALHNRATRPRPAPPACHTPCSFAEESRNRSAALRKLGFVDGQGSVTLKGRAACEIDTAGGRAGRGGAGSFLRPAAGAALTLALVRFNHVRAQPQPPTPTLNPDPCFHTRTADELVAVEMMFDGTFGGLDPHALVALVSCLVPVDRSNVRSPCGCGVAGP